MLDSRGDIVAAYYVTTHYVEPDALQDELHFELEDPPAEGGAAPPELFREIASGLPSVRAGMTFTFGTRETLPRVRRAGALLWARDEARP